MATVHERIAHYGESHRHPVNKALHWVCVPLIMVSLLGLLWMVPVPAPVAAFSPFANWATALVLAAMAYYFALSVPLALGMIAVSAAMLAAVWWLSGFQVALWVLSLAIFAGAWIGQFVGHHLEGRRPSFFEDVRYLLVGPVWLLAFLYRRLGIRY